jgi:hypothetical protein
MCPSLQEMKRLKATHPDLDHASAFKMAASSECGGKQQLTLKCAHCGTALCLLLEAVYIALCVVDPCHDVTHHAVYIVQRYTMHSHPCTLQRLTWTLYLWPQVG